MNFVKLLFRKHQHQQQRNNVQRSSSDDAVPRLPLQPDLAPASTLLAQSAPHQPDVENNEICCSMREDSCATPDDDEEKSITAAASVTSLTSTASNSTAVRSKPKRRHRTTNTAASAVDESDRMSSSDAASLCSSSGGGGGSRSCNSSRTSSPSRRGSRAAANRPAAAAEQPDRKRPLQSVSATSIVFKEVRTSSGKHFAQILPDLLLGSQEMSRDRRALRHFHVTHILNVTVEVTDRYPELFTYKRIAITDMPSTKLVPHFDEAFRFIDAARSAGGCVLVHCYYGNSRSASFIIGYLMTSERMRYADALAYVRLLRPDVKPNDGFQRQLKEYESRAAGGAGASATR